ncbi:MAG: response regulator transcription factor [Hyphomicrobiaceae bacterium]|nr:response regulator transcription factor [Hyphomicrobiaceae bacterium]MCC0025312.1 response regulator transcription factor [Hyphomicrobiaceae bacterium]
MATQTHILVVDDDLEIRRLLGRYLSEQGFRVSTAGSRQECNERLATGQFDIVILDVLLPDGSGLDICRYIRRQFPDLPVILVTALKEDVDRIIGLEIGADDYLGKPFNPRELLARIRAVIRRTSRTPVEVRPASAVFRFSGLTVNIAERSVMDSYGATIALTGAEFELLRVFLERPGRVLSREQLLDLTQHREAGPFERSIDVLVSRLRRKLGKAAPGKMFETIRNGGYQFTAIVSREEAD